MAIPFDYTSEYKRKLRTPEEAARVVKSGDWLDISMGGAFPSLMDEAIAKRKDELRGVKIRGYLIQQPIQMVECDPDREHFIYNSWHMSGYERKLCDRGLCNFNPMVFRNLGAYYDHFLTVNVAITCVTPMNEHGYFNFSVSNASARAVLDKADVVILEVNENLPWVYGLNGCEINIKDVDMVVEGENPPVAQLGGVPPYVASVTAAGACKQQGRLEGFYRLWQSPDPAARWQPILTPLYLALATVLALVAALAGHQMNRFLWLWSALLSATVPLSLPLSGTLPLSLLCRRLHKSGCAVAGWKGARAISAARRVVVTDEDLFPAGVLSLQKKGKEGPASAPVGTVELNGLKVYGEEINQALAYAEALCRAAGSQLTPLFQQLMDGQVSFRYDAHDLHYYEDGGVDCTIRGATVAMGSAYFMKKRRITLPRDLKMDTGVFMSVDGRLAAIFVVKYLPSRNVEWALRALRRNRVTPVLATRGVNITPNMLKRKFRLNARPIYPGVATRLALADLTGQRGEAPNAIIYRDGLLPMAETVIGSQRMCQAVRWSTALGWIGGLCGLVLSYYLTTAGDFAALSPLYMLAFLALLLLPTLLLSGLVKYY